MQGTSYFQLLNPMVMAIFAIGFLIIWHNERQIRSALFFAAAYMCGAVGFVLDFAVRDAVGPYWGQYVSNVWLVAIPALITAGIAKRHGEKVPFAPIGAVYVATFAIATLFLVVWPNAAARAMTMNGGTGLLVALSMPILWRHRQRVLTKFMFWIMLVTTVQFFIRPAMVIAYSGFGPEQVTYSDSLYALTLHLTSAVCAISLAATLLFALGIDVVKKLHAQTSTDELTGLLNRRGMVDGYEQLKQRDRGANPALAVVIADIDHFKSVNDDYGHDAGDRAIVCMAQLLKDHAGECDLVARIGGEEFVMLLPNATPAMALMKAQGIRTALKTIEIEELGDRRLTASMGIAGHREDDFLDRTLKAADTALYAAKNSGRDRVCLAGSACDMSPEIVQKSAA